MKAKYILTFIGLSLFSMGNAFAAETQVVVVPDYAKNFKLFIGLIVLMAVLLLAIYIVGASIRSLAGSDYYKEKLIEKEAAKKKESATQQKLTGLLLLVGMLLFSKETFALSFKPEEGGDGMPWLQVENIDLILLLSFNIALLILYFYLRSVFKSLIRNVTVEDEQAEVATEKTVVSKVNKLLTDVVPVEEEESILLDHEFDGIRELDNNLPPWWVALFWVTIVFSVGYMLHYHVFKTGDLQIAEYEKSMEKAEVEVQAYLDKMAMNVDENTATIMTDSKDLAAGKLIFNDNCIVCHKTNGEGDIGPNLTDEYWLYSNDIKDIFSIIKNGTSKGMPEHNSRLNPIQIQQVASYTLSLPYVEGKEPEGEKFEE